jgi:hypothetical protein
MSSTVPKGAIAVRLPFSSVPQFLRVASRPGLPWSSVQADSTSDPRHALENILR